MTGKAVAIARCNQASDFISQRLLDWLQAGRLPQVRPSLSGRRHPRFAGDMNSDMNQRREISLRPSFRAPASILQTRVGSFWRRCSWRGDATRSSKTIANLVCMHTTFLSVYDWSVRYQTAAFNLDLTFMYFEKSFMGNNVFSFSESYEFVLRLYAYGIGFIQYRFTTLTRS